MGLRQKAGSESRFTPPCLSQAAGASIDGAPASPKTRFTVSPYLFLFFRTASMLQTPEPIDAI